MDLSKICDTISESVSQYSGDEILELANDISNNYMYLSYSQKELADEILNVLVRNSEIMIRRLIATNIRNNPNIPNDIAFTLAKDLLKVSSPIIECSEVLTDDNIVEIIKNEKNVSKNIIVTKRKQVSEKVSTELIETNQKDVVLNLLDNKNAKINDEGMSNILDKFNNDIGILNKMVDNHKLSNVIQHKVISLVTENIQETTKNEIQNEIIEESEEKIEENLEIQKNTEVVSKISRDIAKIKLIKSEANNIESLQTILSELVTVKEIDSDIMFMMICVGELDMVNCTISALTGIPIDNINILVNDIEGIGFKSLYSRITVLTPEMYETIKILLTISIASKGNNYNYQKHAEHLYNEISKTPLNSKFYSYSLEILQNIQYT